MGGVATLLTRMVHPAKKASIFNPPSRGELMVFILPPDTFGPLLLFSFWKVILSHVACRSDGVYIAIWPYSDSKILFNYLIIMIRLFSNVVGTDRLIIIDPHGSDDVIVMKSKGKYYDILKVSIDYLGALSNLHGWPFREKFFPLLFDVELPRTYITAVRLRNDKTYVLDGPDFKLYDVLKQKRIVPEANKVHLYENMSRSASLSVNAVHRRYITMNNPTASLFQSDLIVIVRHAPRMPFSLLLLLPLRSSVWWALAASWAILVLARMVVQPSHDVAESSLYVYQLLITGSLHTSTPRLSQRLLLLSGVILSLIVCNAYSGLLLGFLTVPQYDHNNETLSVVNTSFLSTYLCYTPYQNEIIPHINLDILGGMKITHIVSHFSDFQDALSKVLMDDRAALILPSHYYETIEDLKGSIDHMNPRKFYVLKERLFSYHHSIYVFRNHLLYDSVNSVVMHLLQAGLYEHWKKMQKHKIHLDENHIEEENRSLELQQFVGPYILLGLGYGISTLVFLMELLSIFWQQNCVLF